jgi:hypothetical protein
VLCDSKVQILHFGLKRPNQLEADSEIQRNNKILSAGGGGRNEK